MKHTLRTVILSLVAFLAAGLSPHAFAQDYIQVKGYVYNRNSLAEPGSGRKYNYYNGVDIFIYETEAEGAQALKYFQNWIKLNKKGKAGMIDQAVPHKDLTEGTEWPFTLNTVSPEGALIFFDKFTGADCKLVKVKGRDNIEVFFDVQSDGLQQELEETVLSVERGPRVRIEPPVELGDTIKLNKAYLFPETRMGKDDARFALQAYIISPTDTTDTMAFRTSVVMDGKDYHDTQLRRMGYDPQRDRLYAIADTRPRLSDTTRVIHISDRIYKGPKSKGGLIMADVWFEDYNQVYFSDKVELEDLRRTSKPMQFLEYSIEATKLDPNDPVYKKTLEKTFVPGDMQLPIQFETGKAAVDRKDSMSMVYLDSLKNTVYNITHAEGSKLLKYSILGMASPEGNYARNVSLARDRLNYIDREVRSQVPPEAFIGMRKPETSSRVASWAEFADTLAKDSTMIPYADQIRAIADKYSKNPDEQNRHVKRLPFYNTIIKDNLHRLRLVNFFYTQTIFRELTPAELIEKFHTDPMYMTAEKGENFIDAEFWVLMQHLRDTSELETICRRAIARDNRRKQKIYQKWVLPANVLAEILIKQNRPDTTLLAPYIDETDNIDRPYQEEGKKYRLNATPVVANQVSMMLLTENYTRAVQLAEMFKNSTNPQLMGIYAIARCKAGYFNPTTPEGRKYYSMIHDTSPRNAVVMDMAIPQYMDKVPEELEQLNPEDPVTWYLKAQWVCYKYFQDSNDNTFAMIDVEQRNGAIRNLVKAFNMDPELVDVAAGDWFIFKGLYEDATKEYREPGSVLEPEPTEEELAAAEAFTDEQKKELVLKSIYHPEEMTDEDWAIYDKYDLANYSISD